MPFHDLDIRLKLMAVLTAAIFMVLIVHLVKRRALKENYALLWIVFASFTVLAALNFNIIRWIAHSLGIANPNNALFFLGIIFLTLIVIVFTMEISYLYNQVKNLIQEVSILKNQEPRQK